MSRNTIRKYLRSDAVEVKFKVPERSSRLDPFADKLSGWLEVESGKGRKARRTARRLHADLIALSYDGSYARVAAFIRDWQAERTVAQRTTVAVCSCRSPSSPARRSNSTGARTALRLWLSTFVDQVVEKQIIAAALTETAYVNARAVIHNAIERLTRRAVESGDLRHNTMAIDLLRALIGVLRDARDDGVPATARRLVPLLLRGTTAGGRNA